MLIFSGGLEDEMILLKNNVQRPCSGLAMELEWTCALKSSDSASNMYKLSVAAAIYWLWRERNRRQFQGVGLPAQNLGAQIIDEVRSCLCSWRNVKRSDAQ